MLGTGSSFLPRRVLTAGLPKEAGELVHHGVVVDSVKVRVLA
jgi:hypothetical protein